MMGIAALTGVLGFASLLGLPAPLQGHQRATVTVAGRQITVAQQGRRTVLMWTESGKPRRLVLAQDETVYAGSLTEAKVLGSAAGEVVVLETSYSSNPSGGQHQCGAGTETLVRVIQLAGAARQTFAELVESCWASMDDARDVAWDPAARVLAIEHYGGAGGYAKHFTRRYQVGVDGRVSVAGDVPLPD